MHLSSAMCIIKRGYYWCIAQIKVKSSLDIGLRVRLGFREGKLIPDLRHPRAFKNILLTSSRYVVTCSGLTLQRSLHLNSKHCADKGKEVNSNPCTIYSMTHTQHSVLETGCLQYNWSETLKTTFSSKGFSPERQRAYDVIVSKYHRQTDTTDCGNQYETLLQTGTGLTIQGYR